MNPMNTQVQAQSNDSNGVADIAGNASQANDVGGVTGARLRSFIERIERLNEEQTALAEDVKEVYGEAKGTGFDVKTMRHIIKLRAMDANARQEADALLDTYKAAIGLA